MNTRRYLAAATVALTVLLLQGALVAPAAHGIPMSLPAVLVAAVALVDGPGTGLAFGFTVGLLADLGTSHPAGVLALAFMAIGLTCGTVASRHTVVRGAFVTGVACSLATAASILALTVLGSSGATLRSAISTLPTTALGDALLALLVIPVARLFLRTDALRAPAPVLSELGGLGVAAGGAGRD